MDWIAEGAPPDNWKMTRRKRDDGRRTRPTRVAAARGGAVATPACPAITGGLHPPCRPSKPAVPMRLFPSRRPSSIFTPPSGVGSPGRRRPLASPGLLGRSTLARLGLLLVILFAPQGARAATDFTSRMAALEEVARAHFTGQSLSAESEVLAARVDRFNLALASRQAELARATADLEAEIAPLHDLEAQIARSTAGLAQRPAGDDRRGVQRYNALVEAHNALVARYEKEAKRLSPRIEAHQQRALRVEQEFSGERAALAKAQGAIDRRRAEDEDFTRNDGDTRYQGQVNRMLADLREAARSGRGRPDLLIRVRALRRDLAAWAAARHAAEPNGLILVAAMLGDEPCQFVFDTGAQTVTVPDDLLRALNWQDRMGAEETIHGVGGGKVQGRPLKLPAITVLGRVATEVGASALPKPESVGIDGLLGQSFLKAFRITITPGAYSPVQLDPR